MQIIKSIKKHAYVTLIITTLILNGCNSKYIQNIDNTVSFKELPASVKKILKDSLNTLNRYNGTLVLNLDEDIKKFKYSQRMFGSFASDHHFRINHQHYILNLNAGYRPFIFFRKHLYCLQEPMGLPSIERLEKSMFHIYSVP